MPENSFNFNAGGDSSLFSAEKDSSTNISDFKSRNVQENFLKRGAIQSGSGGNETILEEQKSNISFENESRLSSPRDPPDFKDSSEGNEVSKPVDDKGLGNYKEIRSPNDNNE